MHVPYTRARSGAAIALAWVATSAQAVSLVGLTDDNRLLRFDSATPTVTSAAAITGVASGERILSIDFRNPDQTLYGLGSLGNLYALDATSGAATVFGSGLVPAVAAGVGYEIDWNPNNNNLRVIGNEAAPNSNRAFTFATGVAAVQTALNGTGGPIDVVGAAYNNNRAGSPAATLSLYYLDARSDALYVNTNAFGGGVLTKVGDLTVGGNPFGINNAAGFDIAGSGDALMSWRENLYAIDLATGALSVRGQIGAGGASVIGLTAVAPIPEPETYALMLAGLAAVGFMTRRQRAA